MWLVASYCISFFKKSKKNMGKTKMQMLLFSCSFFLFRGSVLYVYFFSLSKRPKNVTLCYMNVRVLIYLWFAKMKIWSMLQVLSPENEKKKNLLRMIAYVFVWWGRCVYSGGFQGVKEDRRLQSLKIKKVECSCHGECIKVESRKFLRSLEYFLVPPPPPWCHYCPFPIGPALDLAYG